MQSTSSATRPHAWSARLAQLTAFLLALTMISAVGCGRGSDSATSPTELPAGVYTLRQVNGTPLPVQVYKGPYYSRVENRQYLVFEVTMTGGTFTLGEDGVYHSVLNYVVVKDGQRSNDVLRARGTYVARGNDLTFVLDGDDEGGPGSINRDGTLTVWMDVVAQGTDKAYVYTK